VPTSWRRHVELFADAFRGPRRSTTSAQSGRMGRTWKQARRVWLDGRLNISVVPTTPRIPSPHPPSHRSTISFPDAGFEILYAAARQFSWPSAPAWPVADWRHCMYQDADSSVQGIVLTSPKSASSALLRRRSRRAFDTTAIRIRLYENPSAGPCRDTGWSERQPKPSSHRMADANVSATSGTFG